MNGIDVSYAQGKIDWEKVAASGIDFAIIKASQGKLVANPNSGSFPDPRFRENIIGAHEVGIPIGVYHYLCAETVEEAVSEAEYFLSTIEPYRDLITLWAVCDVEEDKYLPNDKRILGKIVSTFLDTVASCGFSPMLYANPNYLTYRLPDMSGYPLWLAYWGVTETRALQYEPKIWQHGIGNVDGISGNVDVNTGYFDTGEGGESVREKEWWEDPLEWAQKNGIIYGDENGNLMLDEPCTRRQMLAFLYRTYKLITEGRSD